jgi:hypothetical protein
VREGKKGKKEGKKVILTLFKTKEDFIKYYFNMGKQIELNSN